MLVGAVIGSECVKIAGQKNIKNPMRTANWWGSHKPCKKNLQEIESFLGDNIRDTFSTSELLE